MNTIVEQMVQTFKAQTVYDQNNQFGDVTNSLE